jgi:hypothetical protein
MEAKDFTLKSLQVPLQVLILLSRNEENLNVMSKKGPFMSILVDILNTLHEKFDPESQTTLFNVLELLNAIIPQPYMQERFFGLSQENRKPTSSNFETVTKLLNDCSDSEVILSGV